MASTQHGIENDHATSRLGPTRPALGSKSRSSVFVLGLVLMAFVTIFLLLALILVLTRQFWDEERLARQTGAQSNLGLESTVPISCHSHNDYWREAPLQSALRTGCIGIEADVWPYRGELYVAHDRGSMTSNHTLSNMYLDPIFEILQGKSSLPGIGMSFQGVYDLVPEQTLVLLVDLKTDPSISWPILIEKLQPFREQGWLSHVTNNKLLVRPITIVTTGAISIEMVENANPWHDIFFDAPLAKLDGGIYNSTNSYYASVSFRKSIGRVGSEGLRQSQLFKLRDQIEKAHSRGLKVRYWSLPAWPTHKRDQLWKVLFEEGLDILNIDDLRSASGAYAER
ncbi:Fc.00g053670.m01.CDS01 [Cosmosporella sp. VM-42]